MYLQQNQQSDKTAVPRLPVSQTLAELGPYPTIMRHYSDLRVLVVGASAAGAEAAHALVQAGVRSVTMYDPQIVTERDYGLNFLLPPKSVGKRRGQTTAKALQHIATVLGSLTEVQSADSGDGRGAAAGGGIGGGEARIGRSKGLRESLLLDYDVCIFTSASGTAMRKVMRVGAWTLREGCILFSPLISLPCPFHLLACSHITSIAFAQFDQLARYNEFCRANGIGFCTAEARGAIARTFTDFGRSFTVYDDARPSFFAPVLEVGGEDANGRVLATVRCPAGSRWVWAVVQVVLRSRGRLRPPEKLNHPPCSLLLTQIPRRRPRGV